MKKISIYWQDVNYYDDGKSYEPSNAYTEGMLFKKTSKYLYIKYPTTIITYEKGSYNHPLIKPKFLYIPVSSIDSIEYHAS